jgi:hypothetical protein
LSPSAVQRAEGAAACTPPAKSRPMVSSGADPCRAGIAAGRLGYDVPSRPRLLGVLCCRHAGGSLGPLSKLLLKTEAYFNTPSLLRYIRRLRLQCRHIIIYRIIYSRNYKSRFMLNRVGKEMHCTIGTPVSTTNGSRIWSLDSRRGGPRMLQPSWIVLGKDAGELLGLSMRPLSVPQHVGYPKRPTAYTPIQRESQI